jgi:MoaA/NifB/PqqE/SkfB family radical SAM enzyme
LNNLKPYNESVWESTGNRIMLKENHCIKCNEADDVLCYEKENGIGLRINRLLNSFQSILDTPILRLSGGEIFILKRIEDYIRERSSAYDVVQIVTNGYYLEPELIYKLKMIGNINIHFSLDGHTLATNGYRNSNPAIHERLLKNLDCLIKSGIPTEINSVMSNKNTETYQEFLDYLLRYDGEIIVYPTPIRGEKLKKFQPTESQVLSMKNILNNYNRYSHILPPREYLEDLFLFYEQHHRTNRCYLPIFAIQMIDDGAITPCPLSWTVQLCNLLQENSGKAYDKIKNSEVYRIFNQKKVRLRNCHQCFASYEIINLYFKKRIC